MSNRSCTAAFFLRVHTISQRFFNVDYMNFAQIYLHHNNFPLDVKGVKFSSKKLFSYLCRYSYESMSEILKILSCEIS